MSKVKISLTMLLGVLVFTSMYSGPVDGLLAQDNPGRKPSAQDKTMSDSQTRGEGLFLQRCSLCHLPRIYKFGSPPVVGPSLIGAFKSASPDQEKILRQFIQRGTADMPGFQYGLDPRNMDDLVSYLKTL